VHEPIAGIADIPGFCCEFLVDEIGGLAAGVVLWTGGLGGLGVGGGKDGYGNDQGADGGQGMLVPFGFGQGETIQDMGGDVISGKSSDSFAILPDKLSYELTILI